MSETVTVCTVDELPEGSMRVVEADGHKVGVFNCGATSTSRCAPSRRASRAAR
jgi:hypothetical protein